MSEDKQIQQLIRDVQERARQLYANCAEANLQFVREAIPEEAGEQFRPALNELEVVLQKASATLQDIKRLAYETQSEAMTETATE